LALKELKHVKHLDFIVKRAFRNIVSPSPQTLETKYGTPKGRGRAEATATGEARET
jgi:hypothetical protein